MCLLVSYCTLASQLDSQEFIVYRSGQKAFGSNLSQAHSASTALRTTPTLSLGPISHLCTQHTEAHSGAHLCTILHEP